MTGLTGRPSSHEIFLYISDLDKQETICREKDTQHSWNITGNLWLVILLHPTVFLSQNDELCLNSLRPIDEYMRQYTNHHWFR